MFFKNVSISENDFVMSAVVEMKGILVDCEKKSTFYGDHYVIIFGMQNLYV